MIEKYYEQFYYRAEIEITIEVNTNRILYVIENHR